MLPFELGGVVDPNLKVYGTANVRVADASVYPIQFAAHVRYIHFTCCHLPPTDTFFRDQLMAPTYGLAELAAEIIRAQYNNIVPPYVSATQSSSTSRTTNTASTSVLSKNTGAAALHISVEKTVLITTVLGVALLAFLSGFA
jgi:hypothetical protein